MPLFSAHALMAAICEPMVTPLLVGCGSGAVSREVARYWSAGGGWAVMPLFSAHALMAAIFEPMVPSGCWVCAPAGAHSEPATTTTASAPRAAAAMDLKTLESIRGRFFMMRMPPCQLLQANANTEVRY